MSTTTTINLGSIEKIALGHARCYLVGNEEIAIFRQREGTLFATQNRCPHKQGTLCDGIAGGGKVICPLHAHKFELATGVGSEAGESIKVYAVREVNGEILLNY